jgi:hypothetical protein
MSTLEREAWFAWVAWGAWAKWTTCADCEERLYCRSKGGHRYLCLGCFDQS